MKILVHIPSDSLQFQFGVQQILNSFSNEHKVLVMCQKIKNKKNSNFFLINVLKKIKAHVSVEKKHLNLARKRGELIPCIKNRFSAFFLDSYSREYTQIKNIYLKKYFSNITNNKVLNEANSYLIDSINNEEVFIRNFQPDILIMLGGPFVKQKILKQFKYAINIHMGWIPSYKGARTIEWALVKKDFSHVGSTIHLMTNKLDEGKILWRETCDHDINFNKIGEPLAHLYQKAFYAIPTIIKKIIDGQEIHPTNIKEDKEDKLYYGYEFDYKFYKKMIEMNESDSQKIL